MAFHSKFQSMVSGDRTLSYGSTIVCGRSVLLGNFISDGQVTGELVCHSKGTLLDIEPCSVHTLTRFRVANPYTSDLRSAGEGSPLELLLAFVMRSSMSVHVLRLLRALCMLTDSQLPIRRLSCPSSNRTLEMVRQEIESYALVFPEISFSIQDTSKSKEGRNKQSYILRIPKVICLPGSAPVIPCQHFSRSRLAPP